MIGKSIASADEAPSLAAPAVQSSRSPRAKSAWLALFIAFIALFFTAVGIAAGYKHWQRMHDWAKDNARRIVVLETALATKVDSRDMAALMTMPVTDIAPVTEKINQLLAQLEVPLEMPADSAAKSRIALTLAEAEVNDDSSKAADAAADSGSLWDSYKQRSLTVFNSLVTVRKVEPSLVSTLKTEVQEVSSDLIRLRLENLRLMALRGDDHSYRQQLALLRTTLDEYMTHYAPKQLTACQTILDELAAVELKKHPGQ